jgi:thiaminase/transcriptional activator TenA
MTFAYELKLNAREIWQKILNHRFIIELSNDILPINKFLFYLYQDHYFLEEFSSVIQSAKQKSTDDKMKKWLDTLYSSTVNLEMEMQSQILNSLEVSSRSSSSPSNTTAKHTFFPSKTTLDYTSYLRRISSSGTFSEIISVMAPCPWTYLEIAQQLSKIRIQNEAYKNWVRFYSSNESRTQVDEIKQILNILSKNENEKTKKVMNNRFGNACKYEYLFWEMAYSLDNNK